MRSYLTAGAIIAASISGAVAEPGAQEINGNWYANLVQKISYTGLGGSGSYQRVTDMSNGQCNFAAQPYSGNLSPLDEEVSLHFRGPMTLKQVAVYYPGSASKARRGAHDRRHGHADFHKRNKEIREIQDAAVDAEKRAVGDMVTATIDGQVVSWVNQWDGHGVATPEAKPTPEVAAAGAGGIIGNVAAPVAAPVESIAAVANGGSGSGSGHGSGSGSGHGSSYKSSGTKSTKVSGGDWGRTGYYNADSKTADGVVFLNNMGGQGSGVFDNVWGNSLSYAAADAKSGSASPQVLNAALGSNTEVVMFADTKCSSGSGCGYGRPGTVMHHGFGGNTKAFFFEFGMPLDGQTGFNGDMPSLWMLNAQIPRTGQYSSCSCWQSGCGEFDICEVLDPGNTRCKSTYHGNTPGGSSDYFDRPTTGTMKMAVVMVDDQIHVQQLDASQEFSDVMAKSTIDSICADKSSGGSPDLLSSIFALVS